jgi:hypothetical protein
MIIGDYLFIEGIRNFIGLNVKIRPLCESFSKEDDTTIVMRITARLCVC